MPVAVTYAPETRIAASSTTSPPGKCATSALDNLIAESEQTVGADRTLLLGVRSNRAVVLIHQERYTEAEAERMAPCAP